VRLPTIAEVHGTCIPQNARKHQAVSGSQQRREYRLHRKGKISSMTSPVSRGGKLRFRMGQPPRRLEDRLSELADYHQNPGHCNVPQTTAKTPRAKWVTTKGLNTGCTEGITCTLPYPGIGKLRFRMGLRHLGRPFEQACRLSQIRALFHKICKRKTPSWLDGSEHRT
jgi:hypothetical protein